MKQIETLKSALAEMEKWQESRHLLVGFDGFVDEIIHVVDTRKNNEAYQRIETIKGFSERIASAAGLSANIELVPTQIKLGGNGPIMANALIEQGFEVTYMGALGKKTIHPVFNEFVENCKNVISVANPGHTDALEFLDGKIMLGKIDLADVSFEKLLEKVSVKELESLLGEVSLVAFTNWTMLANLNSILVEFGKIMKGLKVKPYVFIDLADPKKRTTEDVKEVLSIISDLPCKSVLSMNLSESALISLALGINEDDVVKRADLIRQEMGIEAIVIHPVKGAAVSHAKESGWIEGPYTAKPKLTTGAGDNFNAGFCNAWIGGLAPAQCLAVGVCSSGYYVRNAKSAKRKDLVEFMKQWVESGCKDV